MKTQNTLRIRTSLKAGSLTDNSNERALKVRTAVKSGGALNSNERALTIKSGVKGGIIAHD